MDIAKARSVLSDWFRHERGKEVLAVFGGQHFGGRPDIGLTPVKYRVADQQVTIFFRDLQILTISNPKSITTESGCLIVPTAAQVIFGWYTYGQKSSENWCEDEYSASDGRIQRIGRGLCTRIKNGVPPFEEWPQARSPLLKLQITH